MLAEFQLGATSDLCTLTLVAHLFEARKVFPATSGGAGAPGDTNYTVTNGWG